MKKGLMMIHQHWFKCICCLSVFVLLLTANQLQAKEYEFKGYVRDAKTNKPIQDFQIEYVAKLHINSRNKRQKYQPDWKFAKEADVTVSADGKTMTAVLDIFHTDSDVAVRVSAPGYTTSKPMIFRTKFKPRMMAFKLKATSTNSSPSQTTSRANPSSQRTQSSPSGAQLRDFKGDGIAANIIATNAKTGKPIKFLDVEYEFAINQGEADQRSTYKLEESKPTDSFNNYGNSSTGVIKPFHKTGYARLMITAKGYKPYYSQWLKYGRKVHRVTARLEPLPPIAGKVVDSLGSELANASIIVLNSNQQAQLTLDGYTVSGTSILAELTTDATGSFKMDQPIERNYNLLIIHEKGYLFVPFEQAVEMDQFVMLPWYRRVIDTARFSADFQGGYLQKSIEFNRLGKIAQNHSDAIVQHGMALSLKVPIDRTGQIDNLVNHDLYYQYYADINMIDGSTKQVLIGSVYVKAKQKDLEKLQVKPRGIFVKGTIKNADRFKSSYKFVSGKVEYYFDAVAYVNKRLPGDAEVTEWGHMFYRGNKEAKEYFETSAGKALAKDVVERKKHFEPSYPVVVMNDGSITAIGPKKGPYQIVLKYEDAGGNERTVRQEFEVTNDNQGAVHDLGTIVLP